MAQGKLRLVGALLCFFVVHCWGQQVSQFQFAGHERLKEDFLHKIVDLAPGQPLDSTLVLRDIDRLQRMPSVARATFTVVPMGQDQFGLTYEVEENFTLIPYLSLYTSSNNNFALRMGLQEFNLLGRNITLGGFYQYDNYHSYGINVQAPYLFGKRWGLGFQYKDLTTLEPIFFKDTVANYRYNNTGAELMVLHEFNARNRAGFGGSLFTESYQYHDGATDPNVPQNMVIDKYLLKLLYDYDGLHYFYQYVSGFRSMLNLQYVVTKKSVQDPFWMAFNDFLYFQRLGSRGNWANRLRLGLSSNTPTPFAPFALDNNVNIRGVGNVIDRGTGTLVFNTEYRHTWIDRDWFVLQSNVFVDMGSWRLPGGELSDFWDGDNIRVYPGIGLRLMHKRIFNAIFRIDYGYGITPDAAHGVVFGIGQYF